ncbi:MAG: hypothetical protein IKI64_02915 [Clostridia bacterium]|nr:hypothetical protein [Clostridia bacterium]
MYCTNCGAKFEDGSSNCPYCGTVAMNENNNVSQTSTYEGPMCDPTPVLVWGILGLAFALSTGILGIIFSIIGLKKSNQYIAYTSGAYSRKAQIGRKLSIAGIITGAVMTVFFIIYIAVIIFALSQSRYY